VGDDVDAAVGPLRGDPRAVPHHVEQVGDEVREGMSLRFLREGLQHEVARRLLDVLANLGDRHILLHWGNCVLAVEDRAELVGVVLHLEQAHRRAELVEGSLREVRAWNGLLCHFTGRRFG